MAEQRTTPEQRAALRARYTPEPVPTCQFCGDALEERHPPDGPEGVSICRRMEMYRPAGGGYGEWRYRPGEPEIPGIAAQDHAVFSAWSQRHPGDPDVLALCDDADALAGALAACERYKAALAMVLDEMQGCEGRQGMWEDGIDTDYRRAIEQDRAALAPRSGAPGGGAA